MKNKINVANLLKDMPKGIKLYDWLHNIDVELDEVATTEIETVIWCTKKDEDYNELFGYSQLGTLRGWFDGLQILFPSKEMRDWSKFLWKKGDILVNENNAHIIFEKFTDDTYTTFIGRHYLNKNYKNYVPGRYTCVTQHFHIEESNAAQIYIYNIEEKIGGKLDLKTLEIEKPKCEFKTFDKVLGRNEKDDVWKADLFSHYREESQYPFRCIGFSRKYCIPYNKETAHLLGTTDDWEGGEQ